MASDFKIASDEVIVLLWVFNKKLINIPLKEEKGKQKREKKKVTQRLKAIKYKLLCKCCYGVNVVVWINQKYHLFHLESSMWWSELN